MNAFKLLKIEIMVFVIALLAAVGFLVANPPALAEVVNDVRGIIGPQPVAFIENTFYGIADAFQHLTFQGKTTPGYWSTTPAPAAPAQSTPAPTLQAAKPIFQPGNVTPLYAHLAAPGEGVWTPISNAFDPAAAPLMYKTFLHPDPNRPYARVAIVAIDATRVRLHVAAGTIEPVSTAKVERTGLIPSTDLTHLVAAFNGGFRAIHGHYGMMVNGQTILPAEPSADTIALYSDGHVRIAPWSVISNTLPLMQSFRQTPPYLVSQGQVNSTLQNEQLISWGASVSGKTVIWRSALGVSADGRTLYYAVGESLTAQRLAEALAAAGASDAAELDVNLSFERFLTYAPTNGNPTEQVLLDKMIYTPGIYVSKPSSRDFFYLTLVSK